MKKVLFAVFALSVSSISFAQLYQTDFEAPAWVATSNESSVPGVNSWAINGFSGNVNVGVNGFLAVTNTVLPMSGLQNAQMKSSTNNVTDYSATRTANFSSTKKWVSVGSDVQMGTSTNGRGFGLILSSGWRWVVAKESTGYGLYFSNGKTFTTSKLGTAMIDPTLAPVRMSMELNFVSTAANAAFAKLKYGSQSFTVNYTAGAFDSVSAAGMLSRHTSAISSSSSGRAHFDNFGYSTVPEPGSMMAIAAGIAGLVARKRKKS